MKRLTLILFLRNDPVNPLNKLIPRLQKEARLQSLEGRDDVVLVSDNAILVDQKSAHGIFVQLCAGLVDEGWPHILIPIHPDDTTIAVGSFPERVQNILSQYGISMA